MKNIHADTILTERFCKDSLIALATVEDGVPYVRTVDAVYLDGAFYVVTYALSNKMKQITKNPVAAISGEWFTAHGIGENLGHVLLPQNEKIMAVLRAAFAAWYDNGHTNEADPNTCLLKIRLTDGVLFSDGTRYDIDFT
ncbi:MAG: pyridoxamine 5'-phosphate oxidase family protein [Eubacteriales bacterium]|nr:pyridoxamine 5'-phosphate oxidase family protein [Eubacteriales bacterium]